jgi:hypothetical protein
VCLRLLEMAAGCGVDLELSPPQVASPVTATAAAQLPASAQVHAPSGRYLSWREMRLLRLCAVLLCPVCENQQPSTCSEANQQLGRNAELTAACDNASLRLRVCCPHSISHCSSLHPSQRDSRLLEAVLQRRRLDCGAAPQHAPKAVPLAPHCKAGWVPWVF